MTDVKRTHRFVNVDARVWLLWGDLLEESGAFPGRCFFNPFKLMPAEYFTLLKTKCIVIYLELNREQSGRFGCLTFHFLNQRLVSVGNVCLEMGEFRELEHRETWWLQIQDWRGKQVREKGTFQGARKGAGGITTWFKTLSWEINTPDYDTRHRQGRKISLGIFFETPTWVLPRGITHTAKSNQTKQEPPNN